MKIGIFSGTFDPIHEGHLNAAVEALAQYELDHILFVPEAEPRFKSDVTALKHRVAMIELAIRKYPEFGLWQSSELQHTHKTLTDISTSHRGADFFLLIGEDIGIMDSRWPDGTPINTDLATLIVVPRSHHSSSKIRTGLSIDNTAIGVSKPVLRYIKDHDLYK